MIKRFKVIISYMEKQKEIIEKIAEHLGVTSNDIDVNASLVDDLELGPVEISDLLSELSTHFNVVFMPEDVAEIKTIEDLVVLIEDLSLE